MAGVERLQEDLDDKLYRLCLIHDYPSFYIAERFSELRKAVDFDTEKLLQKLNDKQPNNENEKAKLHGIRDDFMGFLEEEELKCLERTTVSSSRVCVSLANRVEDFQAKTKEKDIYDAEEAYLNLALDLINETHELERHLLSNQTIIYITSKSPDHLGSLLYLDEYYLDNEQINMIRNFPTKEFYMKEEIWEEIAQSLNNSLAVPCSRPRTLTLNHVIIEHIMSFLSIRHSSEPKFLYLGSLEQRFLKKESGIRQERIQIVQKNDVSIKFCKKIFNSFSLNWLTLKHGRCSIKDWDGRPSTFYKCVGELCIKVDQIKSFNADMLANLKRLKLFNITVDDCGYLTGLKRLPNLIHLGLEGAARYDTTLAFPKLTKNALRHLYKIPGLQSLSVNNFEIKAIDKYTFKAFRKLKSVKLRGNRIGRFDENAFKKCSSLTDFTLQWNDINNFEVSLFGHRKQMKSITLEDVPVKSLREMKLGELYNLTDLALWNCQIRQLEVGVLDSLVKLQHICLQENNIKRIKRGVFDKLVDLDTLNLSCNPIETIEAYSFAYLRNLRTLSIYECNLKSINNLMFKGLSSLCYLYMGENMIESIDVITESDHVKLVSANMTPEEFKLVQQHLFKDLTKLKHLHLRSNNLKKLDLNCFINLVSLNWLDLEESGISELNRRARPGLLPALEILELNKNLLSFIDKRSFSESLELKQLDLSENKLKRLDDDFFTLFPNLSDINLSKNSLEMTITKDTFASCIREIYCLNLLENKSVRIMDGAFENVQAEEYQPHLSFELSSNLQGFTGACGLTLEEARPEVLYAFLRNNAQGDKSPLSRAKKFYLFYNSFLEKQKPLCLDLGFLDNMKSLDELGFSGVRIESLDQPNLFSALPNLQTIRLINTGLRSINRRAFNGLNKLFDIFISKNNLSNIDSGLFRGLICLRRVVLSYNNIVFLDAAKLFEQCPSLCSLNLSHNKLDNRSVDKFMSIRLNDLWNLNLAHNRVESINFVRAFPNLETLDLSHNKIKTIEPDGHSPFVSLMKTRNLKLAGNPIEN